MAALLPRCVPDFQIITKNMYVIIESQGIIEFLDKESYWILNYPDTHILKLCVLVSWGLFTKSFAKPASEFGHGLVITSM